MEGITRSIQFALETLDASKNRSQEELQRYIGPPLRPVFAELLENDDPAVAEEALRLYRVRYADVGMMECYLYPGIPEAIENLHAAGFALYLATSKPHIYATQILNNFGLGKYFTHMHGSELNGVRDDKAELIEYIVATEKLTPAQGLMIGDRKYDIIGGKANGLHTAGVTYGFGGQQELTEAGADVLFDTPEALASWLLQGQVSGGLI
jgi:phosphoglycolate phosphatase